MTKRMLNVLKTEEISYSISLNVVTSGDDTPNTFLASSGGDSSFTCPVGSLIEINWRILNRKDVPLVLSLRIQPCQDHHNGHVELQTKDKLMILGSLQDVLPPIPPHGGTFVFKLPMLLLSKGDYKFLYHAEMVTSSQSHPQKAVDNVYWGAEPIHLTVK